MYVITSHTKYFQFTTYITQHKENLLHTAVNLNFRPAGSKTNLKGCKFWNELPEILKIYT